MAGLFSSSLYYHSLSLHLPARASFKPPQVGFPPAIRFSADTILRRPRGAALVAGAGPSTGSYVFAFVFPLSLLAVTVFASIRIADKLDRDFLEELAINQALREADDEEDDNEEMSLEEQPTVPRTRNRPKREA